MAGDTSRPTPEEPLIDAAKMPLPITWPVLGEGFPKGPPIVRSPPPLREIA